MEQPPTPVDLEVVVTDISDALWEIDSSGVPFKLFAPGVGPYGEPQLTKLIAEQLNKRACYHGLARTKRTPDLLIGGQWAIEIKLTRPFGDNGRPAEDWSVNMLHPYPGNVSALGDCLKLRELGLPERKAVVVIGYEHSPPQIDLSPLLGAFEVDLKRSWYPPWTPLSQASNRLEASGPSASVCSRVGGIVTTRSQGAVSSNAVRPSS